MLRRPRSASAACRRTRRSTFRCSRVSRAFRSPFIDSIMTEPLAHGQLLTTIRFISAGNWTARNSPGPRRGRGSRSSRAKRGCPQLQQPPAEVVATAGRSPSVAPAAEPPQQPPLTGAESSRNARSAMVVCCRVRGARRQGRRRSPTSVRRDRSQSRSGEAHPAPAGERCGHAPATFHVGCPARPAAVPGRQRRVPGSSSTRQEIREARGAETLAWITSRTFRKTAATILDEAALPARLVADQLGHSRRR